MDQDKLHVVSADADRNTLIQQLKRLNAEKKHLDAQIMKLKIMIAEQAITIKELVNELEANGYSSIRENSEVSA